MLFNKYTPMLKISYMELMVSLAALVILALVALLVPVMWHNQTDIQMENTAFQFQTTSAN